MVPTIIFTIVVGVVFPLSGMILQKSWNNQLGDVYSLGLGSAACLGGALAVVFNQPIFVGALLISLLASTIAWWVSVKFDVKRLLTFGMIFGATLGSLGTIVVTNATPESLQTYYMWASSSFFNIDDIHTISAVASCILVYSAITTSNKNLTLLYISFAISLLVSVVGFVGMISLVAPNLARLFKTSFKNQCVIASSIGLALLSITNLLIHFNPFSFYLPASATMSLLATPLIVLSLLKTNILEK